MNSAMANVIQGPSLVRTALHRPSPSLMFVPGLRSLPFWTSYDETSDKNRVAYQESGLVAIVDHLESRAADIRQEFIRATQSGLIQSDYDVSTHEHHDSTTLPQDGSATGSDSSSSGAKLHSGQWDWYSYMQQGEIQPNVFNQHFPETLRHLTKLQREDHLFDGTPFGFAFFSRLHARSSIKPHTAPMNFRLRIHLPLIVPTSNSSDGNDSTRPECGIRVGPSLQRWHEGKALVLDDSYEHEVWNETDVERVLLLIDIWHPDLRPNEREEIKAMFQHAKQQGWMGSGSPKPER